MIIELAVAFVWGAALTMAATILVRPILAAPVFQRTNYRGSTLAVGSGIVLVVANLLAATVGVLTTYWSTSSRVLDALRYSGVALVPILGFAFLGFIDDVGAIGETRGFLGHLRSLRHGQLTTGGLKLFGGGCLGLLLAQTDRLPGSSVFWLLLDAAIVALAANLGNLFDRAPGRTLKISALALFVLAVTAVVGAGRQWDGKYVYVGFLIGVIAVMLRDDLREIVMLGDTGSNPLGAAVGMAALRYSQPVRIAVLVGLIALNLASEKVSFSRVIDRTPPLRWLDRIGARPERKATWPTSAGR